MAHGAESRRVDMVLVSMPFGPLLEPSLGLSLLKAALASRGYTAEVLYLTLPFAKMVGCKPYSMIAAGAPHSTALAGEWIFSADLSDTAGPDPDRYVEDVLKGGLDRCPSFVTGRQPVPDEFVTALLGVRGAVTPFLDAAARRILDIGAPIVGFTSVFQQQLASLALARRLKEAAPGLVIVFGGANCEGAMGAEMVHRFPFVDAAVSGEGEETIVPLVERALAGESLAVLPGVRTPASPRLDAPNLVNTPRVRSMDALPYPRFEDFFEQFDAAGLDESQSPRLLFESARGCWWGEKHHCTFCGLNGTSMPFRSKSAPRVLDELSHLAETYPAKAVSFVDNILDMHYFKDLLPALAESKATFDLFFEVKANLKRDQVRILRDAGITQIQPGVESLSTAVLDRMRKGVSALQNLQLLKWCKEFGITPHWNLLWGFPGEDPAEYARMAKLMPLLRHLPPPTGGALIRLDRFSPNFENHAEFGFTGVEPVAAYRYVYPGVPDPALARMAYFFSFEYAEPRDVAGYVEPVAEEIRRWQAEYESSDLFLVDKGDRLIAWDLRSTAAEPMVILDGLHRAVLLACEVARPVQKVAEAVQPESPGTEPEHVLQVLESLRERGLVITDDGRWLSLGIPLGDYSPGPAVTRRFLETARSLGRQDNGGTVLPVDITDRDARPEESVHHHAKG